MTADTNDFIVQNSSGGLNLVITNPEGNMIIKNSLTESQSSLNATLKSFIIQNSTGSTVAYVNSTGGLFLTGALTGVILILVRGKTLKTKIAFGPFLLFGMLVAKLWGWPIWQWYWGKLL